MSQPVSLQNKPLKGGLWMLLSLACFTVNALLLKLLSSKHHVDAWTALSFRSGVGLGVTLLLFGASGAVRLRRSFTQWLLASRGIFGALGTAAYYITIGPLGAGKATLIGNTWCIFAAVLASFVLHERLGMVKLLGILLALGGLGLLTGIAPGTIADFGFYEGIALLGSVLAAAVVVVIRQLTRTETSATIFASQCIYTLLLALPFACIHAPTLNGMEVTLLAGAGLCATVGQLGMTEGFRFLSVAAGGALQSLVPVSITLCSIWLFSEPFTRGQGVGALLVLWGGLQTVLAPRSTRPTTH